MSREKHACQNHPRRQAEVYLRGWLCHSCWFALAPRRRGCEDV